MVEAQTRCQGNIYEHELGNMKKAKFHYEEGAMLGDEGAQYR
jgi:TPR repeat protein